MKQYDINQVLDRFSNLYEFQKHEQCEYVTANFTRRELKEIILILSTHKEYEEWKEMCQ